MCAPHRERAIGPEYSSIVVGAPGKQCAPQRHIGVPRVEDEAPCDGVEPVSIALDFVKLY